MSAAPLQLDDNNAYRQKLSLPGDAPKDSLYQLWAPYLLIGQCVGRSPLAMPRPRYRQDPLPIGPDAPPVELFGPDQPNPPGLELMQQGQLQVVPLGPLFEGDRQEGDESGAAEPG